MTWSPPAPGRRVSLRRRLDDGGRGDLVGFVLTTDASGLTLADRRTIIHRVAWSEIVALREVGVAQGRDPMRTPRDLLDAQAARAGANGRVFVIRLSDLLAGRRPPAEVLPARGICEGEWITVGADVDLVAAGWWAARQDARSMQVRTDDPVAMARLLALGFAERS